MTISSTCQLQAIAYETGYADSTVTSASLYHQRRLRRPELQPGGGHLCRPRRIVTISTTTGGATIRYTTDGTTPSETAGTVYSSAGEHQQHLHAAGHRL